MVRKLSAILLVYTLVLLTLPACKQEDPYRWQGQKWEDMITLFEQQNSMFEEIVNIFSTNDRFFEECRQYEDDSTAWLMSPYDAEKMGVFSESEQKIITSFFEQTHPYMITVQWDEVGIDYINEDKTGAFGFDYYYGGDLDEWRFVNSTYSDFIDLGGNWFAYIHIHKESSQQ